MGTTASAHWPPDASQELCSAAVGSMLQQMASTYPHRPAVLEWVGADTTPGYRSVSYGELWRAARRAAVSMLEIADPGDRVAVWAPNSIRWLVIEYAAALAGLVLVPLNPALTDREVADLITRSGATMLFTVADFRGQSLLERIAAQHISTLRAIFDLESWQGDVTDERELPAVTPEQPFLIQFTSGTTGAPKGAVLTHRAAVNVGTLAAPLLELDDGAVWCHPLPLHHVGGSVCIVMTVLARGGAIVLMRGFDAGELIEVLAATRATAMGVVPTALLALLENPALPTADLTSLRLVTIGGSSVAPALIARTEATLGARIVNSYGQSEAPWIAQTRPADSDQVKALSIGRAGLHREVRIVDPESGEVVAFGAPGELAVRSVMTMSGYLDDPVQTAATIDEDGYVRTGDLCSMTADGVIRFHGRSREVIIRGGENIYPAEVENVLMGHPAVGDAAVVGVADPHWGEQVAAAVRFRDGDRPPDWLELEAFARERLAGFKVPRIWRSVESFPTTASGKIQKFLLGTVFS